MPRTALLATLALVPTIALAEALLTRNEAAHARFAMLPVLGQSPPTGPALQTRMSLDLTNEFYVEQLSRETLLLDGETVAAGLLLSQRLAPRWFWGAHITLLQRGGGFLDRFIENWHDFFGLPNANREQFEQNQHRYQLTRNGASILNVERSTSGLGDVELHLGYDLSAHTQLRSALKLPTGDADRLTGGSLGFATWLEHQRPQADGGRWSASYSAGMAAQQLRGPLEAFQRPVTGFAAAGTEVRLWRSVSALGQLYAHTPLYRSLESDIADPGLQLALGARWRFPSAWTIDLAFQEDLIINASPDFSLHMTLRHTPGT